MSPPANPRARVGHDFGGRFATSGLEISIRAPAWGATSEAQRRALPERVSIRAPAWGATCIVWMASTMLSFQSTRPRGARPRMSGCRYRTTGFNPRARVGRDTLELMHAQVEAEFQSTRPRGARRWLLSSSSKPMCFNPRARVGRDLLIEARCLSSDSFNPRARVGRDFIFKGILCGFDPFQSTRPRGARLSPNWTNTNYSTKQSYIQAATKLTKITRPAVPQFCCQGTRANIVINQHHLPFARHRARRLAKPQGHKVSSHQNAPPFFANSSRGYIHAGYLLTHQ